MPLLVHCPNRCQIRVPSNRMGKVIRCVDCQTPIRIPEIESPLLRTGNWVECRAKRAIKKSEIVGSADFAEQTPASIPAIRETLVEPAETAKPSNQSALNTNLPLSTPPRTVRLLRAKPWRTVEPLTSVEPEDVLTPINLDDAASPTESVEHSSTNESLKCEEEHNHEANTEEPRRLSLIRKLLWFANPFAKGPRRSA